MPEGGKQIEKLIRKRTALGVVVALILLLAAYLILRSERDLSVIAENHLQPYPNLVAPIQSTGKSSPSPYASAFQLYEMGYYDKAEEQFSLLDDNDESVQFYAALTALLDDKAELAIKRLDAIVRNPLHRYHVPGLWYAALGYLMEGNKPKAVMHLREVADSDSNLAASARDLLLELK